MLKTKYFTKLRACLAAILICVTLNVRGQKENLHSLDFQVNPATVPTKHDTSGKQWLADQLIDIEIRAATDLDLSMIKVVFLGNSITRGWLKNSGLIWKNTFCNQDALYALNLGVGGDRTEHILYRLQPVKVGGMGNFDNSTLNPDIIVLMIGTNNLFQPHTPEQVSEGIQEIIKHLKRTEPQAKIILCSVLPTDQHERNLLKVVPINSILKGFDNEPRVNWLNLFSSFTNKDGSQRKELFRDGVHLNTNGYRLWHDLLVPELNNLEN